MKNYQENENNQPPIYGDPNTDPTYGPKASIPIHKKEAIAQLVSKIVGDETMTKEIMSDPQDACEIVDHRYPEYPTPTPGKPPMPEEDIHMGN